MKQKYKKLLTKALCEGLPWGVICTDNRHGDSRVFEVDIEDGRVYYPDFDEWGLIENCRPYLRPMKSMTGEEWIEWYDVCIADEKSWVNVRNRSKFFPTTNRTDWLNAHHFDHRGLIPMGLALEAKEGMYK